MHLQILHFTTMLTFVYFRNIVKIVFLFFEPSGKKVLALVLTTGYGILGILRITPLLRIFRDIRMDSHLTIYLEENKLQYIYVLVPCCVKSDLALVSKTYYCKNVARPDGYKKPCHL